MKKIWIVLLFIFTPIAYGMQSNLPCPSITTLHQSAYAVNEATLVNNYYIANTPPFTIHTATMSWFAIILNIQANSTTHAIDKARMAMLAVSQLHNNFAEFYGGIYVCRYDNDVEVINNDEDMRNFSSFSKNLAGSH